MIETGMHLNMSTTDFIRIFESNISPRLSFKTSYEKAEELHSKMTGHRRYSDYESFRSVKNKRAKSKIRGKYTTK